MSAPDKTCLQDFTRFYPVALHHCHLNLCFGIAASIFLTSTVVAEPVTVWHTFRGMRSTTLSNRNGSSPVLGDPNLSSTNAFLIGYFDPISISKPGDQIILNFRIAFRDSDGISNQDEQFRFGLYDLNGQPRVQEPDLPTAGVAGFTDKWKGYWFGIESKEGQKAGTIRKRFHSTSLHPLANAGGELIGIPTGDSVDLVSSPSTKGGPIYSGEMALEKTPSGLAITGYFGGNGTTNWFAANDAALFPEKFAAVGFLNGGASDCDQINFYDVQVSYAPSNSLRVVSDPASLSAKTGESAEFRVAWGGTGLLPQIQWLENGTNIIGATNRILIVPVIGTEQNLNVYSALLSNVFGQAVMSQEAVLTVTK